MAASTGAPQRVLIYRLSSRGHTAVALPALRLVARMFPRTERWMRTNFGVSSKAAPMAQLLDATGLVDDYIKYPLNLRNPVELLQLRSTIRRLRLEDLICPAAPRRKMKVCCYVVFCVSDR